MPILGLYVLLLLSLVAIGCLFCMCVLISSHFHLGDLSKLDLMLVARLPLVFQVIYNAPWLQHPPLPYRLQFLFFLC